MAIAFLFMVQNAFAAGSCTQSASQVDDHTRTVTFSCTGDAANGSIPDTPTNTANTTFITGWYFYNIEVDPGATAPDAADVLIKNAAGRDLLDGLGTNRIHATATQSMSDSMPFFEAVEGALTLDVNSQATASALYTVKLIFVK